MGSMIFNTLCCERDEDFEENKRIRIEKKEEADRIKKKTLTIRSIEPNSLKIKAFESEDFGDVKSLSGLKIKTSFFIFQQKGMPSEYYEKICELGEGSYGKVFKVIHKASGAERAIKVIKTNQLAEGYNISDIERELKILKNLDHPNIMKVYESYSDNSNFYLVTEYCSEGDLFDKVERMKTMSEKVVKILMFQIISAVAFLHENNVIHGDLKLENILIDSISRRNTSFRTSIRNDLENNKFKNFSDFEIKLIDFGCSKIFNKEKKKFSDIIGTLYYASPEIFKNSYNEKVDVWACGVVMFFLLSGRPPFTGLEDEEVIQNIISGCFDFNNPSFIKVSHIAKDLIIKLLTVDQDKRISAKKALEHAFFKDVNGNNIFDDDIDSRIVLIQLKDFHVKEKFNQAVLTFLTHNFINKEEINKLKKLFKYLDKNSDGKISREELLESYKDVSINISDKEIDEILKIIDNDNSGFIEYEEFQRATVNKQHLITDSNLKIVFDVFDSDKNGKIDHEEIRNILGKSISNELLSKLMSEINISEDISFEQFCTIIRKALLEN